MIGEKDRELFAILLQLAMGDGRDKDFARACHIEVKTLANALVGKVHSPLSYRDLQQIEYLANNDVELNALLYAYGYNVVPDKHKLPFRLIRDWMKTDDRTNETITKHLETNVSNLQRLKLMLNKFYVVRSGV